VTPSLNQGQFIEGAIQSVLAQHYENFEHIIIDGGSTDNTIDILRKYPHLIWVSKPDKGQSDAINKGVMQAVGDWILWLNADDIMLSDAFDKVIKTTTTFPKANYIYGHTLFLDNDTFKNSKCYHIPFYYNFVFFGIYSLPSTGSFICASFFKKNLLNIYFHMVMDTEWILRCGKLVRPKLVNDFLVTFRVSQNNKTSENIKNGLVTEQHREERKAIKAMYVYSSNMKLRPSVFSVYLKFGYYVYKAIYLILKLKSLIYFNLKIKY